MYIPYFCHPSSLPQCWYLYLSCKNNCSFSSYPNPKVVSQQQNNSALSISLFRANSFSCLKGDILHLLALTHMCLALKTVFPFTAMKRKQLNSAMPLDSTELRWQYQCVLGSYCCFPVICSLLHIFGAKLLNASMLYKRFHGAIVCSLLEVNSL